ncbi:MAG TPA: acetyl-CoA carboxylase biotin carboxyl carrier protein [Longimicrobiales bacterium]|nr:acetyl-CoA carboxylase biotin carboxyl carrier protein [Longimicrobiales bacterium]
MAQGAGKQRGKGSGSARSTSQVEQNGRADAGSVASSMVDLEFLRGLIEAVDQSGIDSLEINRAGTRIRIAKTPATPAMAYAPVMQQPHMMASAPPQVTSHAGGAPVSSPGTAAPAAAAPEPAAPASNLVDVKSPMVGTFYRAPAPDAPPYVEVGSHVNKGQTLCILEAMKLMNELECEVDGVIREVLVEDADPVEFGQVLFRVEPAGSK